MDGGSIFIKHIDGAGDLAVSGVKNSDIIYPKCPPRFSAFDVKYHSFQLWIMDQQFLHSSTEVKTFKDSEISIKLGILS